MTFRIGNTPFLVHPLTPLAFAAMLVLGDAPMTLSLIWALAVHEYAHVAFASSFGYELASLRLTPFGGEISLTQALDPRSELAIAAAGPASNVVLAGATALAIRLLPSLSGALTPFCTASLMLAVANLLPANPLDGGRIISAFLRHFFPESNVRRAMALIGATLGALALAVGVRLLFYNIFSQFIILGPFLILSALRQRKTPWNALRRTERKKAAIKSGMGAKHLAVPADMPARDAAMLFAPGAFNVLTIVDDSLKIVGQIGEAELLEGLLKLGADANVLEIHSQ